MKDKVQPVAYHVQAQAVGSHGKPVHITPPHTLCWTTTAWGRRQGKHGERDLPQTPISSQSLALASSPPLGRCSALCPRLLVLPDAARSCRCLGWVSQGAPASKRLSLLPGCATLPSILRQWKRSTRASLPSSGKELFQSRNVTTNGVPHQLIQTEVVKILNKWWSGHSLVL